MIIKILDDKTSALDLLESLLAQSGGQTRKSIEAELRNVRAGVKGEKDAAYFIDFDLETTKNWIVIHDLRLEAAGRVAQIDHLLINRMLQIYVLESKSFHAGMKITEDGEFLRWNDWKKTYEGMASPLAQNERHVAVLKDAVKEITLPTRLGLRLAPTYEPYVLISSHTRIDRPKGFDTGRVVKADVFVKKVQNSLDDESTAKALLAITKVVSQETLEEVGRQIAALHTPASIDYRAKFSVIEPPSVSSSDGKQPKKQAQNANGAANTCRQCNGTRLSIVHGKYGYYFKCADCDGNTPIKIGCGHEGHKERIRKEGATFFRECADCATSSVFHKNTG